MENNHLCNQGKIKDIQGDNLFIEITVSSACSKCHGKSFCSMSEHRNEILNINTSAASQFSVGEEVNITMKSSLGTKAVLFAYVGPLVALCLGLFLSYFFTHNELLSTAIGFGCLTIYFLILRGFKDKFKREFIMDVKKID
jgi:sigma-E factor negative regulatory protein RseC